MASMMDVRHQNSYFTTHVIASNDQRLFIAIKPSDPSRLSLLPTNACIYFALSELTSPEEAEQLSCLINELSRQILIVADESHP
jgi:hypothetical protein